MKPKVFVDGQEGTTGLRIHDYLAKRSDLEVMKIAAEDKKDTEKRRQYLNAADLVFLCLPDQAAREAVSLIDNPKTRVIDASTAHRTIWTYGFPELNKTQRAEIRTANRVSVPGCHATGFVSLAYPLVREGFLSASAPLVCNSLTGYSGGGKSLIRKFEEDGGLKTKSPRPYALKLTHKHQPEMQKIVKLDQPPLFTPVVADFYKGMAVFLPIPVQIMEKRVSPKEIQEFLKSYYAGETFIRVMPLETEAYLEEGFLDVEGCNDTNRLDIFVFGHESQILLLARLDNLGKGASGAAIQNMNLMLGLDETIGLQA